jgi:REP element-mobilizing transposase RayT
MSGASRDAHRVGCRWKFPDLRKRTWGRHFWARGYFSTTSGNITDNVILQFGGGRPRELQ